MAADLGRLVGQTVAERRALVWRIANHPTVRASLRGGSQDAARSVLATLRGPIDTTLSIMILDSARRQVVNFGEPPTPTASQRLSDVVELANRADSLAVNSPLFVNGANIAFWTVAAVRDSARLIGFMAHLRVFGVSGELGRTLQSLIGENSSIMFANTGPADPLAVALDGAVATPVRHTGRNGRIELYERADSAFLAARDTVVGTPWSIVVETPVAATRARANLFLERTTLLSLALLLVGSIIVWLVSRRFVRPILELNDATQAIAARRWDQRVRVDRTDELGVLAMAFNHMADQVQHALRHAEGSLAEAEQANRAKSEFLGAMSHEIRTPINAILGYTDLMELGVDGPLTEAQRARLERVRMSGQHLVSLIDDLLDFTRLETARIVLQPRAAEADEAVRTALAVVDPQATAKSVTLDIEIEPDTRYVGDPKRVEQILINLLGNAVKFTNAGGRVALTCKQVREEEGDRVQFIIADTGIGIPRDRLDTIFEPFVQVHGGYTRTHGGSGLGLTISSRLAHMMGGTITVESEEDVGSTFTLVLPAAE